MLRSLAVVLLLLSLLSCQRQEEESTAKHVLTKLLQDLQGLHGASESSEAVYAALWKPARDNLKERARRASALSGRAIQPAEMLAPSRFSFHFEPETVNVVEEGKWARATILGKEGEVAQTRLFLEEDGWKVALEMPALSPIRARPSAE